MTPEEKAARIAELQAELDALHVPEPIPYPKWITIGDGAPFIVQNADEEARHREAAAPAETKRKGKSGMKADVK